MKKLLICLIVMISLNAIAQKKLREDEVPKDVRIALESVYADCKVKNWAFLEEMYIADITVENQKGKAYFSMDGYWINSKFPVSLSEVPAAVNQYYKNNYRDFKVVSSDLVEENGSKQAYILVLQPSGMGTGEPFKVIFDTKGNLLVNEGPEPEVAQSSSEQSKNEREPRPERKPKVPKVKEEPIAIIPPDVVVKNFMKKFPAAKEFTWKERGTNFIAVYYDYHDNERAVELTKEGQIISVTSEVPLDRVPQMSVRYIDKNYPKAKIIAAEKIEYDRNYVRSIPEQKIQNYSTVTIRIKRNKKFQELKLQFDKTGQFESVVGGGDDVYGDE